MKEWRTTACAMCALSCGLEVEIEDNRIVKVRGDKKNPRSEGYVCRKGTNVIHYQHNADRLLHPLKRVGSDFQRISWDQAIDEIAAKIGIVDEHGPRSLAFMGGAGVGLPLRGRLRGLSPEGLGLTVPLQPDRPGVDRPVLGERQGLGKQYLSTICGRRHHETDLLLAIGWNGWTSHQMAQARRHLKRISDDPDKLLIVIDPGRARPPRGPTSTSRFGSARTPCSPGP